VRWGGWATLIQGIGGGSLLLLLVLAVKKMEVSIRSFLLEKDEERGYKEWYQGTMESIEIKSKRNIRRKRYRKRLQWKKEMTPTLGFSYGRFFSKKRSLVQSDLHLKNNFKNLKINFKQTLIVPAKKWPKFLKMAGCY
jgi:hypothetical protein